MSNPALVITAPYGGIGKALTEYYAKKGEYHVFGVGRETGREWFESLAKTSQAEMTFIPCDCTSASSVSKAFKEIREKAQVIKALIHLVGGSLLSRKIEELKPKEFQRVLDVNLLSSFLTGQEAFRWMQEQKHGNIVFFSSTTAFEPVLKKMPYAVAKAGVNALTMSLALEGGTHGIIVNAIAPCYVMTARHEQELHDKAKNANTNLSTLLERIKAKNPLHAVLYPHDLIPLVETLITTKHIHGQIIKLDLGQTMHL